MQIERESPVTSRKSENLADLPLFGKADSTPPRRRMRSEIMPRALGITIGYAIFAAAWILLSDHALGWVVREAESMVHYSVIKGLVFVLVTSLLLLILMRWAYGAIAESYDLREDQVRAETIAANERRFSSTMIEATPGVLYFYDDQGHFLRWNRNFESVTGYSSSEISCMEPWQFIAEADRKSVKEKISEVFEFGESSIEAGLLTKSGMVIPYFFNGRRVLFDDKACLIGMGLDLSSHQSAEQARKRAEEHYQILFEHAPDGILISDSSKVYSDANPSMCRLLGYSREELIGLAPRDILLPHEHSRVDDAITQIQRESGYHQEWMFRRKDGSHFPGEVIATRMPDGHIMGMVRDITERQRARQNLLELNQNLESLVEGRTAELAAALVRAESADKLKSAFLATMSHELRTPLNSIIGFTGVILQHLAGPLTQEQTKQLEMVRGSARHLLNLINDVLDISKIEAGQLEVHFAPFDLGDSLERVSSTVRVMADKKGIDLINHPLTESINIISDQRRLEQILLNLLNNAVKFTDEGTVTLSAERTQSTAMLSGSSHRPSVRICVKDTGIGIKEEDLPKLFQPFRQLDSGLTREHDGTGLGLAICRKLAGLLGGEISVESPRALGSTFTLNIPISPV